MVNHKLISFFNKLQRIFTSTAYGTTISMIIDSTIFASSDLRILEWNAYVERKRSKKFEIIQNNFVNRSRAS